MDLQQRTWCSDVRTDGDCAKGLLSPKASSHRQPAAGIRPADARIKVVRPLAFATAKRCCYRFAVPRASFFTFRFAEPRAYSRGFNGLSVFFFLRTARLAFLRSSLLSVLVFAMSADCFSSEIKLFSF